MPFIDLNFEKRYLQEQLGFAKYDLNNTCEILLNRIRIDREQKQISAQAEIVITTKPDIVEKMDQWTTKKL